MTDTDRRAVNPELIHRIDQQDVLLREIRDMVVAHIDNEKIQLKAIEELVVVWRGSKIILPALTVLLGMIASVYLWAKDHIR